MFQLRTPQSRTVGLRASAAKSRQRSRLRPTRRLGQRRAVLDLAVAFGHQPRCLRRWAQFPGAEHARHFPARRERRNARIRIRSLVDHHQCKLAARQSAAHRVQHDVGARSRTRGRRCVWARPYGDYLHGRRCLWLSAELDCDIPAAASSPERSESHARRVGRRSSVCLARSCTTGGEQEARWCVARPSGTL